jgi:hypothetical protein
MPFEASVANRQGTTKSSNMQRLIQISESRLLGLLDEITAGRPAVMMQRQLYRLLHGRL